VNCTKAMKTLSQILRLLGAAVFIDEEATNSSLKFYRATATLP